MTVFEIQTYIEEIEHNSSIYEEKSFDKRIEAIDFLETHIIDQVEYLIKKTTQPGELILLKNRAERVKSQLEEINTSLFQKLREDIRKGKYTRQVFKDLVGEYVDFDLDNRAHQEELGYDNLDIFVNGLLSFQPMPDQTKDLEPDMVFYQKTPVRIVFELVEKCQFTKDDIFFDLGSGLGQITILVNLIAGITVKGVEFEPAFCDYARDCASQLNLSGVTFINADACNANYSPGTVFFMYTPFSGEMLQEVLERLRKESLSRKIKIITYGPCTAQVASQSWLDFITPKDDNIYKLAVFNSL